MITDFADGVMDLVDNGCGWYGYGGKADMQSFAANG